MDKQAFLAALKKRLKGLEKKETAQQLAFYSEMIDDRIEEGLCEEDAVAQIGSIDEVAAQIAAELSTAEHPLPKKLLRPWQIVLLILGAPLWAPLVIAAAAVVLSLYVSLWAVLIALWAADLAFALGALAGAVIGVLLLITEGWAKGLMAIAVGCMLGGLAIFLFFGCFYATKGVLSGTKRLFHKKEETT